MYARVNLLFGGAEGIEGPCICRLVVLQHIHVSIIGQNTKISCAGRIPFVVNALHHIRTIAGEKSQWTLISAMARIAFDAYFVHGSVGLGIFFERTFLCATLGVVRGSQKHNDGGEIHPHQQTDCRRDAAIDDVIRHVPHICAKY